MTPTSIRFTEDDLCRAQVVGGHLGEGVLAEQVRSALEIAEDFLSQHRSVTDEERYLLEGLDFRLRYDGAITDSDGAVTGFHWKLSSPKQRLFQGEDMNSIIFTLKRLTHEQLEGFFALMRIRSGLGRNECSDKELLIKVDPGVILGCVIESIE